MPITQEPIFGIGREGAGADAAARPETRSRSRRPPQLPIACERRKQQPPRRVTIYGATGDATGQRAAMVTGRLEASGGGGAH